MTEPPEFEPLAHYVEHPVDEMRRRVAEFHAEMRRRRSIRDFSPRPVPRDIIERALLAAGTAPSGANMQPWHFVAVTDPELKRRIREGAEEEERAFYRGRAPREWLDALAPLGTDEHKPFLEVAPCVVVVFALSYGVLPDGRKVKSYYVQESVGIAVGLLISALHHAGLATLTHTPSPMGFLNEILGRPANERPYLVLVTGYPAEGARVPVAGGRKKTLAEIATFMWGGPQKAPPRRPPEEDRMTTIRMADPAAVTGKTKEIFDAVLRREAAVFGATSVSNIWRCMAHWPALLEANWNRSRALMQRGRFTPLQRELIATAVSIGNACTYWIDSHVAAVMRLGVDEVGVTELMGVSEHTRALATAAAGLCLDSLGAERALVPPLDPDSAEEPARALLEEIAGWAEAAMGRRAAPALWRVLAHNPHYIEATWRKERAVMADGKLSAHDKRRTALGVAMAMGGRYMIEYCAAILKHSGDTDRDILEVLGVVDHYTTLNTLSEGMQIESEIRPSV